MNVLLTSVGQRAYLVDFFRDALKGSGRVLTTNTDPSTPGMYDADRAFVSPPANSDEYIPFIPELCQKEQVHLLSALHDLDVCRLSQSRSLLDKADVANTLPDPHWAELTLDKFAFYQHLRTVGLATPWSTLDAEVALQAVIKGHIAFPLVVKARYGFTSMSVIICHSAHELMHACKETRRRIASSHLKNWHLPSDASDLIIQPLLSDRELCIGLATDLRGNYRTHFACRIDSMRHGESVQATSLDGAATGSLARQLSLMTKHRSIWGIDCIESAAGLQVLDINPRFSGDYPYHHLCGADIPGTLIAWARGDTPPDTPFTAIPRTYLLQGVDATTTQRQSHTAVTGQ